MKRKRLRHVAQNLCQMFCGWRLTNSYPELARLGSGTLAIDALTGECLFNGAAIEALSIAGELQDWLLEDLDRCHIPVDDLREVTVTADLDLTAISARKRVTGDYHFENGKVLTEGTFNRLVILCRSSVIMGETRYEAEERDVEEWPVGWPQ